MKNLISFLKDEEGATAIEYGLIAGLVSIVIIIALTLLGGRLNNIFTYIASVMGDVPNS